jgi:ribosomal protein S18 acetylase RimI-like enzyme
MNSWGWTAGQQEGFARMQFHARRSWYAAAYPAARESIILRGDVPAGSIITNSNPKEIRLVDIALLPEHRNCGIGAHLISKLVRDAAALKVPVTLQVSQSSPAVRLYQRLGFVARAVEDLYLEMEHTHDRALH